MKHCSWQFLIFCLTVCLSVRTSAQVTKTTESTFPESSGYINDIEGILTAEQEKELTVIIQDHEKATTDQIEIVTLTSIEPHVTIDNYALDLFNYWEIGQKDKGNGILIAFGKGLRKIRIQNGYGIEYRLTDSKTKRIIDEVMIPKFKEDKHFEGLKLGLLEIIKQLPAPGQERKTTIDISGENFYVNGKITFKDKTYNGMRLEGLLPNSRMVQGIFDDYNSQTQSLWAYPDTKKWDADRNTNEFIAAMPIWKDHGLLAFTLNLQGGSPYGYSSNRQNWINSAFRADGSLDEAYMLRLEKILNRADELGMVAIVGYFYFGQDQNLKDETAVKQAALLATQWIVDKGYRNVLIEINNECDINDLAKNSSVDPYNHAILDSKRVHELINLVKSIENKGHRLLVSTSFKGGAIPTDNVLSEVDFVLIHGNSVEKPEAISQLVKTVRSNPSYRGNPIVFNEDDHFDFKKPFNNFIAATQEHASWGYFDYRMKDETFEDGYQSMPADWGINSKRKKEFFDLLKKMTAIGD